MIKRTITLPDGQVLKHKDAVDFVQVANRFDSHIMIEKREKIVNAKSLLGILSLGTMGGGDMLLAVDGPDEEAAAEAICEIVKVIFK